MAALVESIPNFSDGTSEAPLDALAPKLPGVRGYTDLDRAVEESGAEAWIVACTTAEH